MYRGLPMRYWAFLLLLAGALLSLTQWTQGAGWRVTAVVCLALTALGLFDLMQGASTLRRNYPVIGHIRYLFETIRPMLRQYVVESDTDEVPFSHEQRAIVYQRAKSVMDVRPFGTQNDVYANRYEWINHSAAPTLIADADFRVDIGSPACGRPYSASVFNISAMSFGSLSPNAILALNKGARLGGFYHDTGEGSLSSYHREHGGDVVWELGSGYFGARDEQGNFSAERFTERALLDQVKMIEIKLSQGAKPGQGGLLPAVKVNAEIAVTRGVPMGQDCISPARHSAFSTPLELMAFIARLRDLSGGKPVGFKLAIGHPWEWFGIAKAMHESGIVPDFIVVDGAEGGTGAAPMEFMNHVGVPMREALMLVHNTLIGLNLRADVRIGAAGKIITAFDVARTLALGADWCNAARGFMFALGCIQSLSCHTDTCPTGVATQDPRRWKQLNVPDKGERVANYHRNTMVALRDLVQAAGLEHPRELGPEHILVRHSTERIHSMAALFPGLAPGALLDGSYEHALFRRYWDESRADSFAPPTRVVAMRASKLH